MQAYFPPINQSEGLPIRIQDIKGKEWTFQFRFWPNNNSRMYVLEGVTPCIQNMQLQAGDTGKYPCFHLIKRDIFSSLAEWLVIRLAVFPLVWSSIDSVFDSDYDFQIEILIMVFCCSDIQSNRSWRKACYGISEGNKQC